MTKYINDDLDFIRNLSDSDRRCLRRKILSIDSSSSDELIKNKDYVSVIGNKCISTFQSYQSDANMSGADGIPNLGYSITKKNIPVSMKYEYIITKVPKKLSIGFVKKLKKLRENIHNSGYGNDYIKNVFTGNYTYHPGIVKMNQIYADFDLAEGVEDVEEYIKHSYEYSFHITEENTDENNVQINLKIEEQPNIKGLIYFVSSRWPGNESISDMEFFDGNSSSEEDIRIMNIITRIKSHIEIVTKNH